MQTLIPSRYRFSRRAALLVAAVVLFATVPAGGSAYAGGANNVVLATTTADGASLERSGLQVAFVGGPTAASENLAQATSFDCTGCTTIAVAVQAVLATGDPTVIAPHNAAVAANGGCTSCATYAYAYQYVLTTAGPVYLSPEGQARVVALRAEIADTAASGLSFGDLTARLDELTAEFRAVIDQQLVAAGTSVNGAATRHVDASPSS
jgi:hypothetical protein